MSVILNIDTALATAVVSLSAEGRVLAEASNTAQQDHAAWLHPAIEAMLQRANIGFKEIQAVAVSIGPGSYTGLRIGLSAAKGFCFALQIPMISIGSLECLAEQVKEKATHLICPMIDARRMEVYAAVYDKNMTELKAPHACIIDEFSFSQLLESGQVVFCGNGSKKLQTLIQSSNAVFTPEGASTEAFARLSQKYLLEKKFTDLAYSEPLYVKEFYSPARKD